MTKRKILIVVGVLISVVLVVVLVGMASLLNMLPGPTAIGQKLNGQEVPATATQSPISEPGAAAGTVSATTSAASEALVADTAEEKAKREKKVADQKNDELFEKLLSEDPTDIRVCDNLGRKQQTKEQLTNDLDFNSLMTERDNAVNEAFRYPVLQVFNDPTLKSFLSEVKGIKEKTENQTESEKDSWLEKAGFYSRMAYAAAKVYSRKSEFEHIGNQAQHLSALARLAALKPEVAANGSIQTLCRAIQEKARDGQPSDLVSERRELVEIFRANGVDPKSIGFDPSKWIHFTMKYDKKSFAFNLSDEEAPDQSADGSSSAKKVN